MLALLLLLLLLLLFLSLLLLFLNKKTATNLHEHKLAEISTVQYRGHLFSFLLSCMIDGNSFHYLFTLNVTIGQPLAASAINTDPLSMVFMAKN